MRGGGGPGQHPRGQVGPPAKKSRPGQNRGMMGLHAGSPKKQGVRSPVGQMVTTAHTYQGPSGSGQPQGTPWAEQWPRWRSAPQATAQLDPPEDREDPRNPRSWRDTL